MSCSFNSDADRLDRERRESSCHGNSKITQKGLLPEPRIGVGQPPRIAALGVPGRYRRGPSSREVEQFAKAGGAVFLRQKVPPSARKLTYAGRGKRRLPIARHGPPSMRGGPRSCREWNHSHVPGDRKSLASALCTASASPAHFGRGRSMRSIKRVGMRHAAKTGNLP